MKKHHPLDDLGDEIRDHIERETRDNIERGMSPEEARLAAKRAFGSTALAQDQVQDVWIWRWIQHRSQDIRFGLRTLRKSPMSTFVTLLTLAVAIGANTTVFTFFNALVLRLFPVNDQARLVLVREVRPQDPLSAGPASYPNYLDWKDHASDVLDLAAQKPASFSVSNRGEVVRYAGALVSSNFFPLLGIAPALGRGLIAEDDQPGAGPVVVLSHALWTERYAADQAIIGRSIVIDGTARTVVGIMPPELVHPALERLLRSARLWIPLGSASPTDRRDDRALIVWGRLRESVTLEKARTRLADISRLLEREYPAEDGGWGATVDGLNAGFSGRTRSMLFMAMAAVSFVLLIACANVANITLARATARRAEIGTRLALGASRGRIVGQLTTESLLIACTSLPPGLALAVVGRNALMPADLQLAESVPIDLRVLCFTIGVAIAASLLAGLVPALYATRERRLNGRPAADLRGAMAQQTSTRLGFVLVTAEVGLSVVLVIGASLFVQTFRNMLGAEGTFDTSQILTADVELAEGTINSAALGPRQVSTLLENLKALPGVSHAAAANLTPLATGGARVAIRGDGSTDAARALQTILIGNVTAEFFAVLGVPITQGRSISDSEGRAASPVAVVNQAMAQRLWPNESPIGHRFQRVSDGERAWFTVIGVSQDILTWDLSDRPIPTAYVPFPFTAERSVQLLLRTVPPPATLAQPTRSAIDSIDPDASVRNVLTMSEIHHRTLSRNETLAVLFAMLGGIAFLLAATGIYGVQSYMTSQRSHEIGIRAALGATPKNILWLILGQGFAITAAGLTIGLALGATTSRYIKSVLFEVQPLDPLTYVTAAGVLGAASILAAYLPARRATKVHPLVALRCE